MYLTWESPPAVMDKMPHCSLKESEFKLCSFYYSFT